MMINPILKSIDTIPSHYHFDKYYHHQPHTSSQSKLGVGESASPLHQSVQSYNTHCPPMTNKEKELILLNQENDIIIQKPIMKTKKLTKSKSTLVSSSVSLSISQSSQSQSRPIITSRTEQFHRYCDLQETLEEEKIYTNATWRMYHRIVKYRKDHPLPEMYYNDTWNNNSDDNHIKSGTTTDTSTSSISTKKYNSHNYDQKYDDDDNVVEAKFATGRPDSNKNIQSLGLQHYPIHFHITHDIGSTDTEHNMMFDLDF